jgi:VWFA-related protein
MLQTKNAKKNSWEFHARLLMKLFRVPLCAAILLTIIPIHKLKAQGQQSPSGVPRIKVTSALVFLDVTVVDKKGRPVVSGLTQDDFTITEDKRPQRIFSFEAPETHVIGPSAGDSNPEGKAPVTILVLDLLNSSFADFAYIRYEVKQFLMAQPPVLTSPTELMVIGNESLEMLQGYTRDRAELLYALDHLPAALPFKKTLAMFLWERFAQSIDALQQIALQNRGLPGRKNIVWVGHGGPNVYLDPVAFPGKFLDELTQYVHSTTNLLVDARMSLFVIYPGLAVRGNVMSFSASEAEVDLGGDDPFSGNVNFGVFVNETGGKLFFNRNDVDKEIQRSERMGGEYYTLTFQPQIVDPDGKFRRIRVTLRDPNLRAITKAGYFAPNANAPIDRRQQKMIDLAEAVQSTIPFHALDVSLSDVVRYANTQTAEFTVQLNSKNLTFEPTEDGKSAATLILAAASLDNDRNVLASRTETVTVQSNTPDPRPLAPVTSSMKLVIRVPLKTQSVRVVVEDQEGERMGAAELDSKTIAAAPAREMPVPQLIERPPAHAGVPF